MTYDTRTEFDDGLSGTTLNGSTVEVEAVAEAGANGTIYRATKIKLDD